MGEQEYDLTIQYLGRHSKALRTFGVWLRDTRCAIIAAMNEYDVFEYLGGLPSIRHDEVAYRSYHVPVDRNS